MIPPMPVAKSFRVLSSPSNVKLLPPPPTTSSSVGSRVTVTAVPVRRTGDVPSNSSNPPSAHPVKATSTQGRAQNPVSPSAKPQIASAVTSSPQLPATLSKVNPVKKDPMKALFMPKNRVPPRVSVQVTGIPSRT